MQEIQNTISCLGIWGILLIILIGLIFIGVFFTGPKASAIRIAKEELFDKKHKKEIFNELDNFTDEEREKLLFLIQEKIKEKKNEAKQYFNDK